MRRWRRLRPDLGRLSRRPDAPGASRPRSVPCDKEIHRVLLECDPGADLDLSLVEHISPITWDNVILYGEYVRDRDLIRL